MPSFFNPIDLSPISGALGEMVQTNLARNKLAMEEQRLGMDQERLGFERDYQPIRLAQGRNQVTSGQIENIGARSKLLGGVAQALVNEPDPAKKLDYVKQMITTVPELKGELDRVFRSGSGWEDKPDLVGHYIVHMAGGYRDPTQDAQAKANLAQTQQTTAQAAKRGPLDLENLQADIDLKKRKDAIEEFIGSLIKPQQPAQGQPSAAPATPPPSYGGAVPPIGSTPAPGFTVQPPSVQKMGAPADAGVMPGGVTPAQFAQQPPAQPAPQPQPQQAAPSAPPKTVQDIIASRSDAERAAFALTLKKDPAKAAVMLQEWANPEHLGKTTQHDVDKRELDASDHLSKLYAIKQGFDPAYLQTKNQVAAWGLNMKDKLNLGAMTPEQQRFLGGYTSFIADSVNNINNQLKILSGTAVSDQEYKRNLMQAPDPGLQGFFSGDGAIAFKAKMDRAIQTQEMAVARYRLARKSGFVGEPWKWSPLESVPLKVNEYAKSLEQKMSAENPGASPDDIRNGVRTQLKTDLGIGI